MFIFTKMYIKKESESRQSYPWVQCWSVKGNVQVKIGLFCKNISVKSSGRPVDDLQERDDAEAKAKTKEPTEGGDEVDWTHSNAPLQLCERIL